MAYSFPPNGELCFLDANIFYYDVIAQPGISDYCSALVREVVIGDRRAATLAAAVADAVHKIMFSEAATALGRPRAGLLTWIKHHPEAVRQLSVFRAAAEKFAALPLHLLATDLDSIRQAADLSATAGLLTNDALIVTLMRAYGIRHLGTNDDDFNNLPDITIWKPR